MDHGARIVSLGCGPLPFLHVESHAYRPGRIKDDGFRSPEQFFRAYLAELLGAMAHVTQEHSDPLPVNVKTARNVVSCWQIDKPVTHPPGRNMELSHFSHHALK